jgi:rhodanese-related sulfurtransferase
MEFILNTNNLILLSMMIISGGMLLAPILPGLIHGSNSVNPTAATLLINRSKAIVLDVRSSEEFNLGHLSRAKNLPLNQIPTGLEGMKLDKNCPLILVCESGNRSASAISKLKKAGFGEVVNLEGGINAWKQAGLPLVK